jgi:predicted transposase YbfD/YdcC
MYAVIFNIEDISMVQKSVQQSFISFFSELEDPRVDNENKRHLLIDIVTISICGVICKCESWDDIADYGEAREEFFKTFLELPNGIPSHDTFRRVFTLINPIKFNECFAEWAKCIGEKVSKEVIAIDGKTACGSAFPSHNQRAIHIVSAWATDREIVLGQLKVDDKSNEITAIPELLNSLDIRDTIITIDAMGTQTEIANLIITRKADYVLYLKKNQGSFYERVEEAFKKGIETNFKNMNYTYHQTQDDKHGRVEERNYFVMNDVSFLNRSTEWAGFSSIGMVESIVTRDQKVTLEKRYYISSLQTGAAVFGSIVRKHWGVENNLHWVLDVQFKDDASIKKEKNSAANFSSLKRAALNLLKPIDKTSKTRKKIMRAMYDDQYLLNLLMGQSV